MIDVTPFMPALNEMILQGDALGRHHAGLLNLLSNLIKVAQKPSRCLTMVEDAKANPIGFISCYWLCDTYSYNTTATTLDNLIAAHRINYTLNYYV